MLKLIRIKKDYKVADTRVRALRGIDLEFRRNEFVCILGPSGCGKTTLLNIIGGLDQYTSGDLVIQGKSTKAYTDRDWDVYRNHKIGFIFQSYNLIPHQTVLGNVELALTIGGVGREERKERAKQALIRVGLGDHLHKLPNQLSGGQMQRVAIARALVNDPAILLADEPTGALDSATSVQIMDLIKEISGERLVIMVTHNPELAQQYATRIVKLKDGKVVSDSMPYDSAAEAAQRRAAAQARGILPQKKKAPKKKKAKKEHASMGFFTALALSARNLFSKKGRTIVTSIAGSIGIISVCLVLALSNGFNNYILRTEEDMLSHYPLEVTESTLDVSSILSNMTSINDMPDLSEIGDKVYVNSFLTNLANGMSVTNNISDEYIDYVKAMPVEYYYAIQYGHGESILDNLFTEVVTGATPEEVKTQYMSLSELKEFYTNELTTRAEEYSQLAYLINYLGSVVTKMPGTADFTDDRYGEYIRSQYDVVAGEFPTNSSEAVLVIGDTNDITDLTLAQLGFIDEMTFLSLFNVGEGPAGTEDEYLTIDFDDVIGKQFTLFFNDAVYAESAGASLYPYVYEGTRASLTARDGEGINIKVSGILRLKKGMTYGCLSSGLNLPEQIYEEYIQANMQSKIVQWMQDPSNALTIPYEGQMMTLYRSPAAHLNGYYTAYEVMGTNVFVNYTQESVLRRLGGDDTVNAIYFYPRDFDAKDDMLAYLDAWNDAHEEAEQVTYSDRVGLLMRMVQTILDVITYVLVAFTAISLVVSSVMIGIITYVSVVERVKEIGVLRSLGARKRDIRNLFNAETFIIGLAAGVIGVAVSYLIAFIVNLILQSLTGIAQLAALPFSSALIMVLISVVLTLISGLIPASAAAKKDPVIALRTE